MEDSLTKLRILARAEVVLFQLRLRRMATQLVLITIGLFLLLLTVGLVNLAGYHYFYFVQRFAPYQAALLVALINAVLAGLLIIVALKTGKGTDAGVAEQLRDLAWMEVKRDADNLWRGVTDLRSDASAIRSAVQAWYGGGMNLLLAHLLQAAWHALALFRRRK